MPFLINNEPLTKKGYPDHYQWLEDKKAEIQKSNKKYFTFSAFDKPVYILDEYGRKRKVEKRRGVPISAAFSYYEGDISISGDWTYIKSLVACKSLGDGRYSPIKRTMILGEEETFSVKDDLELIVFLKFMSRNKNIREIDHQKINKEKAQTKALESQVYYYIFNEKSPINPKSTGSELAFRNISMAWGVTGAESLDIFGVMDQLWKIVQEKQLKSHNGADGRGYEQFCRDVEQLGGVEERATVKIALDRGVLFFDEEESSWKLNAKGGTVMFICGVPLPRQEYKEDYVMKHVISDDYYMQEVKNALDQIPVVVKDYKSLTREQLITEVEKLGWPRGPLYRTSSEELMIRLKDRIVPD